MDRFSKSIPILQIAISGNKVSEYYSSRSIESFRKMGYNNFKRVEATVPETYKGLIEFTHDRVYGSRKRRPWDPAELAIWESHLSCWKKVIESDTPCIIIEHDCIHDINSAIRKDVSRYPLFSLAVSEKSNNIAACAYYIKPLMAKRFTYLCENRIMTTPVDGFIHEHEPWYPYSPIPEGFIKRFLPCRHYINPDIGTVKKKLSGTAK